MKKYFPLNKKVSINSDNTLFLPDYTFETEIPLSPHPGSFGFIRKNHIHEGVDLYANDGDPVFSIEDGVIIDILPFTGTIANSPWWNDTYCVLVAHNSYVINYGEITPSMNLSKGSILKGGDIIGNIRTVLLQDKGRPMSMLHLEMYTKGTIEPIKEWSLNTPKPEQLLDPTSLLLSIYREKV